MIRAEGCLKDTFGTPGIDSQWSFLSDVFLIPYNANNLNHTNIIIWYLVELLSEPSNGLTSGSIIFIGA